MNKFIFFTFLSFAINVNAQTSASTTVKNRAISTKNYVINDRQDSYIFRGVFTLNKRESLKSKIEEIIGKSTLQNNGDFWNHNGNYSIELNGGEIKFSLQKNNDAEFYYYKMKELEKEVIQILDNPGPKNIAVSTKSYVLNDNATVYSLKTVFHNRKNNAMKDLIMLHFGQPKAIDGGYLWTQNGSYSIKLIDGVAYVNFGKSSDDEFYYNKIKTLGNEMIALVDKK
jgi:hypothetical protein